MSVKKPITIGGQFGRLTLIAELPMRDRRRYVICRCECGIQKTIELQNLKLGKIRSCGCLARDLKPFIRLRHGCARKGHAFRTNEYHIWTMMLQRCENPRNQAFKYYGGRGIKVCERWHVFENFLADMGPRPAGLSLDRENNDGNYEPGNVRWATALEQRLNRRDSLKYRK